MAVFVDRKYQSALFDYSKDNLYNAYSELENILATIVKSKKALQQCYKGANMQRRRYKEKKLEIHAVSKTMKRMYTSTLKAILVKSTMHEQPNDGLNDLYCHDDANSIIPPAVPIVD